MLKSSSVRNLFIYGITLLILYGVPFNSQVTLNTHNVGGIRLDHLLHLVLFIPIPLLVRRTLFRNTFTVVPLLILGAVIIEGMHLFIPRRSFSIYDILANTTGALIGVILAFLFRKRQKSRLQ